MTTVTGKNLNKARPKRMSAAGHWLYSQGLATTDIAIIAGVSSSMVSHWLTGRNKPKEDLYWAVAALLGNSEAGELRSIIEGGAGDRQ